MLDTNIYDYQTFATQGLKSSFDSLFHSVSSFSFGHGPLGAEVKSLKHKVIEMKNTITELKEIIKDMAGHSRVAGEIFLKNEIPHTMQIRFQGMSGCTAQEGNTELRNMLSNIYTEEKKKAILQNPNRLGQRVEVKPSGLSAKNELIEASKIFFKSHNNVLDGIPVEMDDCELERQYDLTYTAMKNFVSVCIISQFTLYPGFTWIKIGFKERELLALINDDLMFSYLGADNCLRLFAFIKSWGAKTLLVATIRTRIKSILKTKIQPDASTTNCNEIEESEDELARDVNTSVSANKGDSLEMFDCYESDESDDNEDEGEEEKRMAREIKALAQKTRECEFALEQARLRRSVTSSKNNKGPVARNPRKQQNLSASIHPSVVTPTTRKYI
ncbi:uncharacterized protein EV154DRAFT_592907 [Mucor mucedo]|uniref:uncharacterized protein n=1 Tax=Mucor mucedo TaxID=29922 RepID=UPI00221E99B1|nr:uncharacterized protein EV154DRAFT_592907 [Mucor mucedo]KAI7888881.1 hypothetical protein EV154DRAFT_592907 [Mucor mucedo]